jgi:hypothetical protein
VITASRVGTSPRTYLYVSTTETVDGDLDLIAIEHAMNGRPVTLTPAERVEVARRLYEHGHTLELISKRIGSARDTVTSWRDNGWPPPEAKPDEPPIDIGDASHGRPGYNRGCRCPRGRAGASESNRIYRERRASRKAAAT